MSVTCATSVIFSGTPVSSFNKTDRHDVAEILLKVALNTISQTKATSYVLTICCVQLSQVRGDYFFVNICGIVNHHSWEVIICFVDICGIVDNHCLPVVVRFVDIGGIVDHLCLKFLFIIRYNIFYLRFEMWTNRQDKIWKCADNSI